MYLQIDYELIKEISQQFEGVVAECGNQRDIECLVQEHHNTLTKFIQWAICRLYGTIYGPRFEERIESLEHFATLKHMAGDTGAIRVVLRVPPRVGSQMIGRQGMAIRLVAQVLEMVTKHSPIFLDVLVASRPQNERAISHQSTHTPSNIINQMS